jgi:hypothetical protein
MTAQKQIPDSHIKANAASQFEHALVGAEILVRRRHEIVAGMMGEGRTLEESETAFVEQLRHFLDEARRHGRIAELTEEEMESRCAHFDGAISTSFRMN